MASCPILASISMFYLAIFFEYLQCRIQEHIAKPFIQKYFTVCLLERLYCPSFNSSSLKLCSNNSFQPLEHMRTPNSSFKELVEDIHHYIFLNINKKMILRKVSHWIDIVRMLKAIFFNPILGFLKPKL